MFTFRTSKIFYLVPAAILALSQKIASIQNGAGSSSTDDAFDLGIGYRDRGIPTSTTSIYRIIARSRVPTSDSNNDDSTRSIVVLSAIAR